VEEAKKKAPEKGAENWKKLVKPKPPRLNPQLKTIISQMYEATTNELTQKKMFSAPKLEEIIKKYAKYWSVEN
jgi:hypothetical protein